MTKQQFYSSKCNSEILDPTEIVVSGQSQSVYDLYRKMVLGNIDAADFVRPVVGEDKPDIDNPDITNSFGVSLEDAYLAQQAAQTAFVAERNKLKEKHQEKSVSTEQQREPEQKGHEAQGS